MKSNTSSLWAKVSITVPITKEKVWDVLTLPELTQRYMYNCQLHSSWELGSKAIWSDQLEDGSWHDHVVANVVVHNPYEQITLEIIHQATEEYPSRGFKVVLQFRNRSRRNYFQSNKVILTRLPLVKKDTYPVNKGGTSSYQNL